MPVLETSTGLSASSLRWNMRSKIAKSRLMNISTTPSGRLAPSFSCFTCSTGYGTLPTVSST
eukprot:4042814-Prymnesium_polylepis.1